MNEEHDEFRWLDISESVNLIQLLGQRRMIEYINEEFIRTEPSEFLRIKID